MQLKSMDELKGSKVPLNREGNRSVVGKERTLSAIRRGLATLYPLSLSPIGYLLPYTLCPSPQ